MQKRYIVLIGSILILLGWMWTSLNPPPLLPLKIHTATRDISYGVEMARSDAEQQKGLMYRRHLPENQGMVFIFSKPTKITMWMKNTYISLDMLFINENGYVIQIVENTTPESETIISSQELVRAVLEINAGQVAKNTIAVGNKVLY